MMACLSVLPQPRCLDASAVASALVSVAERTFFAYAEPGPPEHIVSTGSGWYSASVGFGGPFAGHLTVAMPVDLACDLRAAVLGVDTADLTDEPAVRHLVGEFASLACGTWLTSLAGTPPFDLTYPEVHLADSAPAADFVVAVNDRPVVIQLMGEP